MQSHAHLERIDPILYHSVVKPLMLKHVWGKQQMLYNDNSHIYLVNHVLGSFSSPSFPQRRSFVVLHDFIVTSKRSAREELSWKKAIRVIFHSS